MKRNFQLPFRDSKVKEEGIKMIEKAVFQLPFRDSIYYGNPTATSQSNFQLPFRDSSGPMTSLIFVTPALSTPFPGFQELHELGEILASDLSTPFPGFWCQDSVTKGSYNLELSTPFPGFLGLRIGCRDHI